VQLRRALAIFAKAPIAGQVKTRLAPVLTPEGAASLYRCFLLDTVELAMKATERPAWAVDRRQTFIFYTPPEAWQVLRSGPHGLEEMIEQPIDLLPQGSGDLGSRMSDAFQDLFMRGYEAVVIIGGDLPTLPLSRLNAAFAALERRPGAEGPLWVVLGPSLDGGYYLIGLRAPQPALFEGIAWGTSRVLGQTVDRITRLGLKVECLEPWYDVDTVDDLDFLVAHLRLLMACGRSNLPRRTIDALLT
jgi:rSAM/selenodomain-associated transferase 1